MTSVFVKKSDRIKVTVYTYDSEGQLQATFDKSEIPDSAGNPMELEFLFRRPSHSDSTKMMKSVAIKEEGRLDSSGLSQLNDTILTTLLVGWNIIEDGEHVPFDKNKIHSLHPAVARAAATGLLSITGI